jgi:hypothetical protein
MDWAGRAIGSGVEVDAVRCGLVHDRDQACAAHQFAQVCGGFAGEPDDSRVALSGGHNRLIGNSSGDGVDHRVICSCGTCALKGLHGKA